MWRHSEILLEAEHLTDFAKGGFIRLWQSFMTGRVLIAFALLLLQMVLAVNEKSANLQVIWLLGLCVIYLVQALVVRFMSTPTLPGIHFQQQWWYTVLVDLVFIAVLQFSRTSALTYQPLFVFPVLAASVLATKRWALGTAALCALLVLCEPWFSGRYQGMQATPDLLQAALVGSGLLLVAVLSSELIQRLKMEHAQSLRNRMSAQRNRAEAQIMRLINEQVIQVMEQGVLVLDEKLRVRSANPAALLMLGLPVQQQLASVRLTEQKGWLELVQVVQNTFLHGAQVSIPVNVTQLNRFGRVHLTASTQSTTSPEMSNLRMCVMFMQDLRESEAKLRTEKLASMGRMSAAVAHEIRNPLAAIVQANALLEEEVDGNAMLRRLTGMVGQNAQRLGRIVDDILDVARVQEMGGVSHGPALVLDAHVRALCHEWAEQHRVTEKMQVLLGARDVQVSFQADHLRRILVNLLDNALRYASAAPGAIQVSTRVDGDEVRLMVWSDGAQLDQGVQRHLFEPFFSSESRSSGLGLYICRELCLRNGASIGHEWMPREVIAQVKPGNEFFITLKRCEPTQA